MLEVLEDLGLSHAESKIYLSLLKIGPSKTGKIIDTTGLQSSTVYHVIGSLVQKGLISYIYQGKIKYYQAENPENLLSFLEEKRRKLANILPKLKKQTSANSPQTAKVYQGIKGLQAAYYDILLQMGKSEEYYFFQSPKKHILIPSVKLFFRNYHLKREENKIKVKGLGTKETKKEMQEIFGSIKLTKIRYLDEFAPTGLVIYKDKVITLDWENTPTAFVLQSQAVANSYKKFFEHKWKYASTQ